MAGDELDDSKSCGSQLFAGSEPSNEWGLEELGLYAQMQYHRILDGEKLLTPAYWHLGHALILAKKAFKHGKWSHYLKELGIDKTRASKARAIHRTFDDLDELAKLTVAQAYAKRQRKKPTKPGDTTDSAAHPAQDVQRLRKSVRSIGKRTEKVIHDAAFAAPEEAVILVPVVRKAIRQLQDLLDWLEKQSDAASGDAEAEEVASEKTRASAT
jgi:hypothetical protein